MISGSFLKLWRPASTGVIDNGLDCGCCATVNNDKLGVHCVRSHPWGYHRMRSLNRPNYRPAFLYYGTVHSPLDILLVHYSRCLSALDCISPERSFLRSFALQWVFNRLSFTIHLLDTHLAVQRRDHSIRRRRRWLAGPLRRPRSSKKGL